MTGRFREALSQVTGLVPGSAPGASIAARRIPVNLTRRSFLEALVVVAGTIEGCSSSKSGPAAAPVEDGQRYFPQSIASGDPRPDGVVLWTRIVDDAAPGDRTLTLEVATDADFQS